MRERLAALGFPGVQAQTFHAAASRLLATSGGGCPTAGSPRCWTPRRRCWPRSSAASRRLQVHRHQGPGRRAGVGQGAAPRPSTYQEAAEAMGRTPPIPGDLFAGVFRRYERAKERAGRIDFEDMLVRMLEGFETREDVAEEFRGQYRWFSVDESGHQPAAAGAAGGVAGGAARPGRGRRRGPDHLHPHRGDLRVPDRLQPPVPRGQGGPAGGQLPLQPGDPGPGQPAAGRHPGSRAWCGQAAGRDPAPGAGADRGRRGTPSGRPRRWSPRSAACPGPGSTPTRSPSSSGPTPRSRRSRRRWPRPASATRSGRAVLPPDRGAAGRRRARSRTARAAGGGLVDALEAIWFERFGFRRDEEPDGEEARQRHASLVTLLGIAERVGDDAGIAGFLEGGRGGGAGGRRIRGSG